MSAIEESLDRLFDIGQILSVVPISGAVLNCAYRIDSSRGAFCLKRHRPDKTMESLQQEQSLLNQLPAAGFVLAPQLVPMREGAFNFEMGGYRWSLYDFIESDVPFDWTKGGWSAAQCFNAGKTLALFHTSGQQLMSRLHNLPGSVLAEFPQWVESSLQAIARAAASGQEFAGDAWLASLVKRQNELLKLVREASERVISLDNPWAQQHVLAHGDFHPGNLLFSGDKVKGLVDFEYAHKERAPLDLGYAALFFAGRWEPEGEAFENEFFDQLLLGYRNGWPQPSDGNLLLPDVAQMKAIVLEHAKVACFLTFYWLLDQYRAKAGDQALLRRTVGHSLRVLTAMERN